MPSEPASNSPPQQESGATAQAPRRPGNPRVIWIAGVAILVLLLLALLWYLLFKRGRESTDDAFIDGRAVAVAAKIGGYVRELAVNDNQRVGAGDLLLSIDPRDYRNALDAALGQEAQVSAQLDVARLNLQVARTAQPADLISARATLSAARANYVKARADLERERRVDARATTQSQIDAANAQERSAAMEVRDAQARVNTAGLAPQNIAIAESQMRALQAQLAAADAQAQQAQLNVSYTELRALQAGRVTRRNVERGDFVQPGQTLLELVTPEVWVTANFKENQLTHMRPGQPVSIRVDAYPKLRLRGHVDSVQMGSGSRFSAFPAENATGNFVKIVQRVPVKILIDSGLPADQALPLGLSVEPTVDER
ncbi:MAG TPA: HlyD family secretion protein [Steroidobacteraceae bacterium]